MSYIYYFVIINNCKRSFEQNIDVTKIRRNELKFKIVYDLRQYLYLAQILTIRIIGIFANIICIDRYLRAAFANCLIHTISILIIKITVNKKICMTIILKLNTK